MAKGASFGATFAGVGLFMMFIFSTIDLGLAAAVVAQDRQSKIGIAHLVVVCFHSLFMCTVDLAY